MSAKRQPVPTMGANPAYIRADMERRRSGAAGRHAQGTRRQRTRQDARRAAVRDQY